MTVLSAAYQPGVNHQTAKTSYVTNPALGIKYAYRHFGANPTARTPVLFLMHFRGTMDYWDPLLINSIAAQRPVILFDSAGIGQSTGEVADNPKDKIGHIVSFLSLIEVKEVHIFGFSIGGMLAPLVWLNAPRGLVHGLIIAGAEPTGGEDVQRLTEEESKVLANAVGPEITFDNFRALFFYDSESSAEAGRQWWKRVWERNRETSGEERSEPVSFGYKDEGKGLKALNSVIEGFRDLSWRKEGSYDRLGEIQTPVYVMQGKKDVMIPTHNSYVFQQRLPDARLKIFPDSGHGFLYQFAEEVADDVNRFLELKHP